MRSAAALTFILHNSALYNQLVGGLWGGQLRTHRFIAPHTRWLKACLKTDDVTRSYPCLSWISPMQRSTATLNPCDDGASMSTREWQHFFQPEHKCLSIRRVYRLLNAAETGESAPAEEWVWEEFRFSKTTAACQRAESYPTINHCWSCSLLPAVNAARQQLSGRAGGGRTDCGRMSPHSLLLSRLLQVSSVNILTSSGVSLVYLHRQSFLTFPGFCFVLLLHNCVSNFSLWCYGSCWDVRLRTSHLHIITRLVLLCSL